ncbi:MAG TPA: long-chain N-acyl amino acid synthase [Rhodocyclaceae bacterium]|nr:long-chain N-acyl amino acid synthase [Zoogloeaceae bacterium]HRD35390.1 long-chain N-acyl amino acid synthase [Rhodocyclaceae bacterium]
MTEFAHNAITPSGSSRAISGSCSRPAPCVERRRGGRIALKEPYPHHIEIADGDPHLQAAVSQLVRTMYSARGLHVPIEQTTTPVASPRTTTLVARAGEKVLGTVTVGADARSGLLADERYRAEVDRIRMHSIGLCEFTRLAIDPLFSSPRILANMFNVAFVLARHLHRANDLVMEVNPRHVGYYRRMLGCTVAGAETICPRVGAPAILLHLSLEHVQSQIEQHHAGTLNKIRNLYRLSFPPPEQPQLLATLLGHAH